MPAERPTLARRQLGRRLRRLREAAGLTVDGVAAAVGFSRTKLWRIEQGRGRVGQGDVLSLARLFAASPAVVDELVSLANGTRDPGWGEGFEGVPPSLNLYADLESVSTEMLTWHPELVHGLLQTKDYARAVIEGNDLLTTKVVQERVEFRLERQATVFHRESPLRMRAVLGAGALALQVKSAAVMEQQLEHLRALSEQDHIDVLVLPWTAGAHPATKGAFTVLDFDNEDDPALVHLETHVGTSYLETESQLGSFRGLFDRLCERAVPIREYRT